MKKRRFPIYFSVILITIMMMSIMPVSGASEENFDIVESKNELANKHKHLYQPEMSLAEKNKRTEKIEDKINELVANGVSEAEIKAEMEKINVFLLDIPEDDPSVGILNAVRDDIEMVRPLISYDAATQRWTITGGGHWKNDNWQDHIPTFWNGVETDIGNDDAVGITFYNTSGSIPTTVSGGKLYVTDHDGWTYTANNPSDGDGSLGISYEYQDIVKYKSSTEKYYLGKGFSASISYDQSFSNYSGKARSFHVHTWSNATIDSVNFGASGGSFGVNISISNSQNAWKLFNDSDLNF